MGYLRLERSRMTITPSMLRKIRPLHRYSTDLSDTTHKDELDLFGICYEYHRVLIICFVSFVLVTQKNLNITTKRLIRIDPQVALECDVAANTTCFLSHRHGT